MARLRFFIATMLVAFSLPCQASWSLPGIFGHDPGVTQPGRNWLADNPLAERGAAWSLTFKDGDVFRVMERGKAYHYNYVWREKGESLEPNTFFIERTLNAARFKGAGAGPESAVVFAPDGPGDYNVSIKGTASVQRPDIGAARLEIRVVDAKSTATVKILTSVDRRKGEAFEWNSEVQLKAGEALALMVSGVNTGAGSCGYASLEIKGFSVRATSGHGMAEGSIPLDAASWRPKNPSLVTVKNDAEGGIRFDIKAGPGEWSVLDGPTITIPERDKFSLARRLILSCEGDAKNANGIALQIRAVMNGKGYARSLRPHAYWDASLELAGAEKFHGWTQLDGSATIPGDCSKLSFEIWLAVPKTGTWSISLRNLEFNEGFTKSNLIRTDPATGGNIFFSGSGLMKVEFADAANATAWSVKVFDENDKTLSEYSGKSAPAPLSVPLPGLGFYRIVAATSYANGTSLETETTSAVVGEPLSDSVRMNSRFGSGRVWGNGDLWKKSGCRWDWVCNAISLQDWLLNADGSVSPPPGWKPMKLPSDYSPLWAMGSYPKWLGGPAAGSLRSPQDWSLYEKLFEAFAKANPDLEYFSAYNEGNACWSGSIDDFIKFNVAMAAGAKRGNPKVKVFGPAVYSINMDEFQKYLKGGMFDAFDGVNIHAYVNGTPPENEFIDRVIQMCASLKEAGKGDMPVHLSEFGWNSPPIDWQKAVSQETRSRYVARSLSLLAAQPVDNITYFCFQVGTCGYALLRDDGTPSPSYPVYVNTVKWLSEIKRGDARWFRLSPNINLVLGKAGDRIVGVAWTCEGEEDFQMPGIPVKATDMMGRPLQLAAGSSAVKLSPSPMFFELPAAAPFLELRELPSVSTVPGGSFKVTLKGASSIPGIDVAGDAAQVSRTARTGSYLLLGRTVAGGWVGQPVTVVAPITFPSLACTLAAAGRSMLAAASLLSSIDGKAKGTLTLDSGETATAKMDVAKGQACTLSLPVPGFKNGARMKGVFVVESACAIPFRLERPFDQTVMDCQKFAEDTSGHVDWSRQAPVDISAWGPDLDAKGKQNPQLKAIAPTDCSARLKTAVGVQGFHLWVDVTDDVHLQTQPPSGMWQEDSLQLAFDVDAAKEWQYNNIGDGRFNGHRIFEYGVGLPSAGGSPMVWRWRADCPDFRAGCSEPLVVAKITRTGITTVYDILLPWATLGLKEAPPAGAQLGFSLAVNDADKGGDRHIIRFGNGITESKDPEKYGTLRVVKAATTP